MDETSSTGAKLIDFYNKNNIQLYDQEGQLRSLWDTLSDVAKIWDTLDENEQKYFLNIQAGANQSVQLGALMSNFGTAVEATNTALNSSGSAMKENEAYMESLEAKTNLLRADFQDLSNDVISKDMVSGVLDLADGFLQLADSEAGVTVVQAGLAGGLAMSGTALLQASNVLPSLIGSFRTLFTVLSGGELAAGVSVFAGLPAAIGLATVAVVGLVAAFSAISEALDPVRQMEQSLQDFKTAQEGIDKSSRIIELADQYDTLRAKIDSGKLSTEEMESATTELNSVRSELASLTDGLISSEAEYGNQLDHTVDVVRSLNEQQLQQYKFDLVQSLNEGLNDYIELSSQARSYTNALADAEAKRNAAFDNLADSGQSYYKIATDLIKVTKGMDSSSITYQKNLDTLEFMYEVLTGKATDFSGSLTKAESAFEGFTPSLNNARNAFNYFNAGVNTWQNSLDEVTTKTQAYENNVIQGFVLGVTDQTQALSYLQAATERTITEQEFASKVWGQVSSAVSQGNLSTEEAIEVMGRLGWTSETVVKSLDSYWEKYYSGNNASKSFVDTTNKQIDALLSLEDELANAQLALAEYQAALEGGDRGDLADTLEGQYAQVLEDIQSGYVNTKQQDAFFKLIFDKDIYEQYADDFMARAEIFNQEWMQALFNTEEGATLGTNLLDIAEYYADATSGAWTNANGEIITSFDTTTGQLNSISLDALQQEFGLSDTLITAMADDLRGLGYDVAPSRAELISLAESMEVLSTNAQGVQSIDLGAFISGLAEMGRSEGEISTLVGYLGTLQEIGAIDITGTVDIEGADEAITKAIEAQDKLDNLGNTTGEGTADVNTQPAISGVQEATNELEGFGDKTATGTATVDYSGVTAGIAKANRVMDGFNGKTVTGYVNIVTQAAAAEGTDYAIGGPTLVNEEGPEIIRDGDRAFIANGGRPGIVNLHRGAQVFTAEETKEILNGFNLDSIQALAVGAVGNSAGIKRKSSKWGNGASPASTSGNSSSSPVSTAYSAGYSSGYAAASQDYSSVVQQVTSVAGTALNEDTVKEHQNIISLLEAEYSLMEKQGSSSEELNNKANEIQDAYHNLNEYLRGTTEYLNGDKEVLKDVADNSANWYEWQEKIVNNLAEAPDIYTAIQNLLSSNLDLLQAQEGSLDDQVATILEYQDNLHTEAERLRAVLRNAKELRLTDVQIAEIQTKINELGKEWWEWQDKVYEATIKTSREYDSILDLLQAEFNFLEAQNNPLTSGRRVDILTQEQAKLHEEAERLREILATSKEQGYTDEQIREIQTQILGLSKQWWEIEDKKVGTIKKLSREYSAIYDGLEAEYKFIEASGRDTTGRERIAILTQEQEMYHEEAERLRDILAHAKELKLTETQIAEIQAEINGYSEQWWENEKKKKDLLTEYLDTTLDKEKEAIDALGSQMQKYYQAQIDEIDEQIIKLNEANDTLESQIELEEKLDAIAQARSKKVMVYKDGRWQYVSDSDAVSSTTESYEEYQRKKKLDEAVVELEKQKESLQDLKDSWSDFSTQYNDIQEKWLINQELGFDTSLDNWQSFVEDAEIWANRYIEIMGKMEKLSDPDQFKTYNSMASALDNEPSTGGESNKPTSAEIYSHWSDFDKNIDYAQKILDSESWDEAQTWATRRRIKMEALGISEDDVGTTQSYLDRFGQKFASGTLSAPGGLSLVGEKGAELRILGNGDGIIPNNLTQNLMAWGSFTPNQYASQVASITNGQIMNVTIQALNLPNVTDGMGFVDYVKNNMFGQVLQLVH